jgi:hypothetical protein
MNEENWQPMSVLEATVENILYETWKYPVNLGHGNIWLTTCMGISG